MTRFLIEIEHKKELPDDVTDVIAQRVYTYLHAMGVYCDINVALVEPADEPAEANG